MALPAGRYGVTKNQLLKIKKLPMNTIKLIEELTEKFDLLGTAAFKNSTSVVTESSDLVESGAVKDIVGWGNKNLIGAYLKKSWDREGKLVDFDTAVSSLKLPVVSGQKFRLSKKQALSDSTLNIMVRQYTSSGAFSSSATGLPYNETSAIYTVPDGIAFIAMTQFSESGHVISQEWINENEIMACDANITDVTYEPYHESVSDSLAEKADNSVIAPVENGANASQAYAVGQHFIRDGAFCTCIQAIAQGGTFTLNTNYTTGDVASELTPIDITSEFTFSSDVSWNTDWCQIVKIGNTIRGSLRFVTPSELATDFKIITVPTKYKPKSSKSMLLSPLLNIWDGTAKGLLTISALPNLDYNIFLASNAWATSTQVVAKFEYTLF